jgi:hypothetical protein
MGWGILGVTILDNVLCIILFRILFSDANFVESETSEILSELKKEKAHIIGDTDCKNN